jgi:hypothetical protein
LQLSATDLENNYGLLQSYVDSFWDSIKEFTISDNPMQLLGPEIMIA